MAKTITSYGKFWPFYLAEHSKPATRAFHYAGTAALVVMLAWAAFSEHWWAILLSLPALYAFAWFSHFFIEHNKPATFTYPVWSLISDFRMSALAASGRIGAELEKYQIRPRA
jgi:hypothetical protein